MKVPTFKRKHYLIKTLFKELIGVSKIIMSFKNIPNEKFVYCQLNNSLGPDVNYDIKIW